ncbi:MAG: rhodanese-like domain-containing protein [Gammaproteobacteria bacterium]
MARAIKPETLKSELTGKLILDVRRAADREAAPEHLAGAHWKNPEQLADWADSLPKDRDIVLYCARGGSVSNGCSLSGVNESHCQPIDIKQRFVLR